MFQGNVYKAYLEQGTSRSPYQFGSLVTVLDEPFNSLGISRYLESEELRPGSRWQSQHYLRRMAEIVRRNQPQKKPKGCQWVKKENLNSGKFTI